MTLCRFPVSPKATQKAQSYIDSKCKEVVEDQGERAERSARMLASIGSMFGDQVSGLVIGNTHIPLQEPAERSPSVEDRWTQALNEGRFVAAIQAGFITWTMFQGDKHVRMHDRTLEELVDQDLIHQLAPGAVVYGPGDIAPWPDLISGKGFTIWVDDRAQFDALWARCKDWMKTDWFDQTLAARQKPHRAAEIFHISATYGIAPDLSWRQAQFKRAEQMSQAAEDLGAWDALAQQELKKIVGSLAQLQNHPLLGDGVPDMLATISPLLAHAMDGKERANKLSQDSWKARDHLYAGFQQVQSSWQDHTPASPLPAVIPPPIARKPRRR